MNIYYWAFLPADDGSTREDILIETSDRATGDPVPDVIDVTFFSENADDPTVTSVRTAFLTPTTEPQLPPVFDSWAGT
jgi:hypothetical protein